MCVCVRECIRYVSGVYRDKYAKQLEHAVDIFVASVKQLLDRLLNLLIAYWNKSYTNYGSNSEHYSISHIYNSTFHLHIAIVWFHRGQYARRECICER
jgi:hypothetical protein